MSTIEDPRPETSLMCAAIQHILGDLNALRALPAARQIELRQHLETCDRCAAALRAYHDAGRLLRKLTRERPAEYAMALLKPTAETQSDELVSVAMAFAGADADIAGDRNRGLSLPDELATDEPVIKDVFRSCAMNGADSPEARDQMGRWTESERAMCAVIDLLEQAARRPAPPSGTITLTWLLDSPILDYGHTLWQDWITAVRKALDHGWDVRHLIRSTADMRKAPRMTECMRQFLGANGMYRPVLMSVDARWRSPADKSEPATAGYEFVVVPGVGGVRCDAPDGRQISGFRRIDPGEELELVEARLARGADRARRVYENTYASPSVEYQQVISRMERFPSGRYSLVYGLSESLIPYEIHRQRAAEALEKGADQADVRYLLMLQRARLKALDKNVIEFEHFDVCPVSAIRHFVRTGVYQAYDTWMALGASRLSNAQIKQALEALIRRIQTQPNYHFLLLETEETDMRLTEFLAKPGCAAMIELWLRDAQGQRKRVDLEIREPSIVEAFHDPVFWSEIKAHSMTSMDSVTKFLQEQLGSL